jgi:hypothetical protein
MIRETMKRMTNNQNKILANANAAPKIDVKPKTPAITAITKNTILHVSMFLMLAGKS